MVGRFDSAQLKKGESRKDKDYNGQKADVSVIPLISE